MSQMLEPCRLRYPTLGVVRLRRPRYRSLPFSFFFFSRTRALVSSFSIRRTASLSSRPRVYSSPFPRPWRLTCLEMPPVLLVVPRDLRPGERRRGEKDLEEFVQLRT